MSRVIDLTKKVFGKLTVLGLSRSTNGVLWWKTRCECGNEKDVRGGSLKTGESKSCGVCVRGKKRTANGESAKWSLFTSNRINAGRRGIAFTLSLEEFLRITGSACHYCGIQWSSEYPKTIYTKNAPRKNLVGKMKLNGTYKHNGIDRVDSDIGYVSDNCVPCCKDCNFAKQRMSKEAFMLWIARAYEHMFKRGETAIKEEALTGERKA